MTNDLGIPHEILWMSKKTKTIVMNYNVCMHVCIINNKYIFILFYFIYESIEQSTEIIQLNVL